MIRFIPICLEWTYYNGFSFRLLHVELDKADIDSSLIGLYASSNFLYVDIFWIRFKLF